MQCPRKQQCNDYYSDRCNGQLPTDKAIFTCLSGVEWLISEVKPYGSNVDAHLRDKARRMARRHPK